MSPKIRRASYLALALVLLPLWALGAFPRLRLDRSADMYFNAEPGLTIQSVASPSFSDRFSPIGGRIIWTGSKAPETWLRFKLPGEILDQAVPRQWLLVVKPSFSIILDEIDLYAPLGGNRFERFEAGIMRRQGPHAVRSRYFPFEIPAAALQGEFLYLRIASEIDVSMDLYLETAVDFHERESVELLAYGILFGALLAVAFHILYLFFSLRDKVFVLYLAFLFSSALWVFYLQGFAKIVFGPMPGVDRRMLWFWVGAMQMWGAVFSIRFLRLKEGAPWLLATLKVLGALGALVSFSGILGFETAAFSISHWLGILLPIAVITAAAVRLCQGIPSALYFLVAWSSLALGGLVFSLMGLKLLPVCFITSDGVAIGLALQAIFITMALADRYRRLELETARMTQIQAHYRQLSITDSSTGLFNKRYFWGALQEEIDEASRNGKPLSLIVLDIDDFKDKNDSLGHAAGDAILMFLAGAVKMQAREGTKICRFGGDEFVLVMPGFDREKARELAEQIRFGVYLDRIRLEDGSDTSITVSVGVAQWKEAEDAEAFFARTDAALYEAKRRGKNTTVLH
ncbi:MAG: diguanylate cyclase [Spirochaetota bacterium]